MKSTILPTFPLKSRDQFPYNEIRLRKSKNNDDTVLSIRAINRILTVFEQYHFDRNILYAQIKNVPVPSCGILQINELLRVIVESIFKKENGIIELSCCNIVQVLIVIV